MQQSEEVLSVTWAEALKGYEAACQEVADADERALKALQAEFSAGCRDLFDDNPDLQSFDWLQGEERLRGYKPPEFCVCYQDPACHGGDKAVQSEEDVSDLLESLFLTDFEIHHMDE